MTPQAEIMDGGKLTLPPEVCDWLRVGSGGRVSFIRDDGGVRMVNVGFLALEKAQTALTGVAERSGLDSDEEIIACCREVRRELYEARYAPSIAEPV